MMDLARYNELKSAVDRARREHDRAVGARDELLRRLRAEHGCGSLEEAERELKRLRKEASGLSGRFDAKLAEFEEEWGKTLEGNK